MIENAALVQNSEIWQKLATATKPQETKKIEAIASAGQAYAREQGNYEAFIAAAYVYIMARRKTTELCIPFAPEHGGDRGGNQYAEWQDNNDVILPKPDFDFTPMQWSRRMKELGIPQDEIDAYFDECISSVWWPSLAGLLKEMQASERAAERAAVAKQAETVKPSEKWHIYHADMREWQAPRQYDFIITDAPYPKEFLLLYEVLAKRAKEWLKPGGLLIAMCGQSYLDEIYHMMSKHIDYYWTAAYLTPGQPTPLRQRQVNTTWKPLLMFAHGDYKGKIFGDVFKSDGNDKDFHKWGQSVSGMFDIISKICLPGQLILDPFCGAGTTGIAALRHGCFFDGVEADEQNVNISIGRLGSDSAA